MARTSRPAVGWTDARKRRAAMFAVLFAVAAVAALWAMTQPWVGISIGGAAPTCSQTARTSHMTVRGEDGTEVPVAVSGCISGLQSVHQEDFVRGLGVDPAILASDMGGIGEPKATSKLGIPSATFWLVAAAALGAAGALVRNTALVAVAFFPLRWSYSAFAEHRKSLVWGMDPAPYSEMRGVAVHSYAYAVVALLVIATAAFVFKVNAEQRKVAFEEFQRGERERPAGLTTVAIIANAILRIQTDRLGSLAEQSMSAVQRDGHPGEKTVGSPDAGKDAARVPAGTSART